LPDELEPGVILPKNLDRAIQNSWDIPAAILICMTKHLAGAAPSINGALAHVQGERSHQRANSSHRSPNEQLEAKHASCKVTHSHVVSTC
jgi:hypothetical protein